RQVAVITGSDLTPRILFDVVSSNNPITPQWRQSVPNITLDRRISPGTAGVVGHDRDVLLGCSIDASGCVLADLPKWNTSLIDTTLIEHDLLALYPPMQDIVRKGWTNSGSLMWCRSSLRVMTFLMKAASSSRCAPARISDLMSCSTFEKRQV